jgi:hypothetical protein
VHDPAMPIGGHHAKSLLHRAFPPSVGLMGSIPFSPGDDDPVDRQSSYSIEMSLPV